MYAVDLVLILLMVVFAVSGYRQGFVTGVLSFAGFFSGALIGLQVGPVVANQFADPGARVIVSLIAVFGLAIVGQALAGWLGTHLRRAIRSQAGRAADDVGGVFVSLMAVLLVAWLVAVPLGVSSVPWLAKSVRNSEVLGAVDVVMPAQARTLSDKLRESVDQRGFPNVFGGLEPTRVRAVDPPDPRLARSQAVVNGRASVVKVLGTAPACSRRIEGSGFVYATERVMTNAHVVAGTEEIEVELGGDRHEARVVVYDPRRDLAVLFVPGLKAPAMPFAARDARSGSDAVVLGYPLDGPYNPQAARIRDVKKINGPDIYESGDVSREVYTIRALVRSGNSGGPLVAANGVVLGVIFAAAADDPNTGFAVTADEAASTAQAGREGTGRTGTGDCA
ncbi:MAG TPA: MarP family serine protease [Pilimelia sp.]|nr:MarP family serine protease [Pilimelia sp.]